MPVFVQTPTVTSPYPGLRPFRRDEHEILFGREEHVAKLAETLQAHHFVAVVGPSGCGKSSLVTAGLLPKLSEGHVSDIEGHWYEATIRPGDRPYLRLAEALVSSGVLPAREDDDPISRIGLLTATLRRGPLGLIEALEDTDQLRDGNLLIVVDQFEEIFRFRNEKQNDQEADSLIALLLETVRHAETEKLPIYIMLTMRSDYLGDCNQFRGLPEAISDSQFLTPRLDRDQRHAAILGPAAMFGGEVEPALVNRLLNDMGDDPDQLPIMQHALMRMWSLKSHGDVRADSEFDQPIALTTDIYEEVGGWNNTLSNHADEALTGLGDDPEIQRVAELMFRSLTQRGPDQNDVRRPVRVKEVAAVAGVETAVIKKIADAFRTSDRCFITPGIPEGENCRELDDDQELDISHESLIRQWEHLRNWAETEGDSAVMYQRLEDSAIRWEAGEEAYLQTPGLEVALKWNEEQQPTAQWASRYGSNFELAVEYLANSRKEKRRKELLVIAGFVGSLVLVIGIAIAFAIIAKQARGARDNALTAQHAAITAQANTIFAIYDANMAKQEAEAARKDAEFAKIRSELALQDADKARKEAIAANYQADAAIQDADKARKEAQAAKIQLVLALQKAEAAKQSCIEAQAATLLTLVNDTSPRP